MKRKEEIKSILFIVFIAIVFIAVSYLSKIYADSIEDIVGQNISGMFLYVLLINLDVVFAPVSIIPLIPIATSIWGWFISGLLTLIGWTVGSIIVFFITRQYGAPIIKKLTSIEDIWRIESAIPEKNIFLGIFLARIFLPFDIMSYAISLFTKVSLKNYALATFLGFAFIAFPLAYIGGFGLKTQLILGLIGIALISISFLILFFNPKTRKKLIKLLKRTFRD